MKPLIFLILSLLTFNSQAQQKFTFKFDKKYINDSGLYQEGTLTLSDYNHDMKSIVYHLTISQSTDCTGPYFCSQEGHELYNFRNLVAAQSEQLNNCVTKYTAHTNTNDDQFAEVQIYRLWYRNSPTCSKYGRFTNGHDYRIEVKDHFYYSSPNRKKSETFYFNAWIQ